MKIKINAIEQLNVCLCCHEKGLLGVIFDAPKDDIVKLMENHQLVLTTDPRLIKAGQLCDEINR